MKTLVLTLFLAFNAPAARAEAPCRLALALAMDVSRSVDRLDFAVQTEGLAMALEDPSVQRAFLAEKEQVALAVYFWSGEDHQDLVVAWTMIAGPADLARVAGAVRATRWPEVRQLTALGEALSFGRALLSESPGCARAVIDVAGDGQNNQGRSPSRVYAADGWEGITVNALAIRTHEIGLIDYFRSHLIRGPGAFVEVAERAGDFPEAIRRKLIRELTEAVALLPEPAGRGGKS